MADLLITGGRVLDPAQGIDEPRDLWIQDGAIRALGAPGSLDGQAGPDCPRLPADGCVVTPGLIDMHVHFREPGMSEEETVASGAAAAVAGGFTAVACMPNTDPALDCEADMNFVARESKKAALAWVFPVGSITRGRAGKELAEMDGMVRGGAVAFSDDGASVPTAGLLRTAMTYAKMLGKPILEHCEDASLAGEGAMNEGFVATVLGLPGIPAESEEVIVERDCALARLTGAHLHLQHISTAGAVDLIRRAKSQGAPVSAEVAPHHLVLTEEALRGYDPNFKVNPPLRSAADVAACVAGLLDGTLDAIASDHAPHLAEEKEAEFQYAPCGMIGLETTVGVLLTDLVQPGAVPLGRIIDALTARPAAILGLERGSLEPGRCGDVTVLDLERRWTVDPTTFRSKSANCPYGGRDLTGKAVATVVGGRVLHREIGE